MDLNSVVNTLSYNRYFKSLIVKNATYGNHGISVANMLKVNQTLTRIVLNNVDSNFNWQAIGQALHLNKLHALKEIDFSYNDLSMKELSGLIVGIQGNLDLAYLTLSKHFHTHCKNSTYHIVIYNPKVLLCYLKRWKNLGFLWISKN